MAPYSRKRSPNIYSAVCVSAHKCDNLRCYPHHPLSCCLLCSFTHTLYIQIQTPDRNTDHVFTCVDVRHCVIVECFEPFLQLHWFQRRHSTLIECMRTQLFSYTFSLIFSASLKMPGEAEITFPIMTVLDELCFLTLLPAASGT